MTSNPSDVAYLAGIEDGTRMAEDAIDALEYDVVRLRLANLALSAMVAVSGYLAWKAVRRWATLPHSGSRT